MIRFPKISIITVSYNSCRTIEDTILSVINQSYQNIEYIIIDGKSKDNTMEIVEKYQNKISTIVSEKDNGIFDAFNKGIKLATGDVIGILNSDDFYLDYEVISDVAKAIQAGADATYGDLIYVDPINTSKVLRYWKSKPFQKKLFESGWMPPHPTFFIKREFYENFGYFNTWMKISNDYEIVLRFLYKHQAKATYIPRILIKMRAGGNSNGSLRKRYIANLEDRMSWKTNGLKMPFFSMFLKPLLKINQYFIPSRIKKMLVQNQ